MKPGKSVALLILLSSCDSPGWINSTIVTRELTQVMRSALAPFLPDETEGRGGYAILPTREVVLDRICEDDGLCMAKLQDSDFWTMHEYGHILYLDIQMPFGSDPKSMEYGANCIAEVLTGRNPPFTVDEQGYRDCTPTDVARTRRIMVYAGIADEQRPKLEAERNL